MNFNSVFVITFIISIKKQPDPPYPIYHSPKNVTPAIYFYVLKMSRFVMYNVIIVNR